MRKVALLFACLSMFSLKLHAESVYQGQKQESDELAQGVCEGQGGEYLGSQALIKTEDGQLHPGGPDDDQVNASFAMLADKLSDVKTEVDKKYGDRVNWEWLESRFICFQEDEGVISFVLRARSTGGVLRSYELTYDYATSDISRDTEGFNLSRAKLNEPKKIGFMQVNGLRESSLDGPFILSVLEVALVHLEQNSVSMPLQ